MRDIFERVLKDYRWTQSDFAKISGYTSGTVCKWGRAMAFPREIIALLLVLDCLPANKKEAVREDIVIYGLQEFIKASEGYMTVMRGPKSLRDCANDVASYVDSNRQHIMPEWEKPHKCRRVS